MSLDYVKKGEVIKASTVNSIINAIGGNQRMSPDLNVTTTTLGPQISLPSNYGGPNNAKNQLLEVGKYQLSGWPMTQLLLGPEIDDCLNSIRLHKPDGTVMTSVSAAVIFKNSDDCPTGSDLSGYLLSSYQFGYDKERHASGWFQTMIEDPYCGKYMGAQLWKYQDGQKIATVFTNVDSDISVKTTLSSLLTQGGEDAEGLSSIAKIDAWKLVDSTSLSSDINGEAVWFPTHEYIKNRGQIDVYESGFQDYDVVLKAKLVCIKVNRSEPDPETGISEVESTDWAWQIPLGPGSASEQGKARSPNMTYGGNPVVFEVEEGDIGDDYGGDATYKNGVITFGKFTAQANEELVVGELWLNLSYDYQDKCVKGQFSDEQESGSYTQDGVLSRNVFIISVRNFTPNVEEVNEGTEASIDLLTYGTMGVLPKDGPKLDTYCPASSSTYFKSIDWSNRDEHAVVNCQCVELYKFDQLNEISGPLSSDQMIVRRPNGNGGAEVKYVPLSSLEISGLYVPPDADIEAAQTSSLQTRELNNGSNVEELFQFHLSDTIDVRISDLNDYDFVVRNPNGGQPYVEYGKLCIDIAPISGDNEKTQSQKSIDLIFDGNEPDYYQLHDMDKVGISLPQKAITLSSDGFTPLLPSDYEFVLRHNGAGGTIKYANLSCGIPTLSGDANISQTYQSIQTKEDNDGNKYHEIYNFDTGIISTYQDMVRFRDPDYTLSSEPGLGCGAQFLVRRPNENGGYSISYEKMVPIQQHERLDYEQQDARGKSIDYTLYDRGQGCEFVMEIHQFDFGCTDSYTSANISSNTGNGILIRQWKDQGCCYVLEYLDYNSIKGFVPENIGDSQLNPNHYPITNKSIDKYWDGTESLGRWAFELYNWNNGYDTQSLTIYNDGCTYYWPQGDNIDTQPSEWDYVLVKHVDSNGNQELQYKLLEVTMPDIPDYGEDISTFYSEINYLSGCIDDLSGQLSGEYWVSGGDSGTCYGSDIANNNQITVIDLDNSTLDGNWTCSGSFDAGSFTAGCGFYVGCTSLTQYSAFIDGPVTAGCGFYTGTAYLDTYSLQVGCSIRIGGTSLSEAQLSALLALI